MDPLTALFGIFRRQRQRTAKRSADVDARLAAGDGERRPADATAGWLAGDQRCPGNLWYLLHGELAGSSFDMQKTHRLVTTLGELEKQWKTQHPQAQLLSRGTVFYSDYASQQAKHDISTLGAATLFGVILLIVATFRSLRPLLLCLISIAIGALAGTVVTLLLFGELHLMTR